MVSGRGFDIRETGEEHSGWKKQQKQAVEMGEHGELHGGRFGWCAGHNVKRNAGKQNWKI